MYGTILTVLIISYPYPIWPRSLGSTMISGTAMPLRCIIKLAPLDPLWTPPPWLIIYGYQKLSCGGYLGDYGSR